MFSTDFELRRDSESGRLGRKKISHIAKTRLPKKVGNRVSVHVFRDIQRESLRSFLSMLTIRAKRFGGFPNRLPVLLDGTKNTLSRSTENRGRLSKTEGDQKVRP